MMKRILIAIASLVAVSVAAGSAQADLVAGWDFSQYRTTGFPTIDGVTGVNTLDANYSSLDPTGNAGAASAAAGTMLMDGSQGSSNVDVSQSNPGVVVVHDFNVPPKAPGGAVLANLDGPAQFGAQNEFNAFSLLRSEGQSNTTRGALSPVSGSPDVVFMGDAGSSADRSWAISFGGRTFSGTSNVSVEYSLGCTGSYTTAVGSPAVLTSTDSAFSFSVGGGTAQTNCVRLGLDATAGRPIIDNVAVPEPGAAAMLMSGVVGLIGLGRLRKA